MRTYRRHSAIVQVDFLAVEVRSFGLLANAVKAEDLHIWRERETGLERIHPFAWDGLVSFDFLLRVRYSVAEGISCHIRIPGVGVLPQIRQCGIDGQVSRRIKDAGVTELKKVAVGDILTGLVVGRPGVVSPNCVAADGQHTTDAGHGAEDFCALVATEELL